MSLFNRKPQEKVVELQVLKDESLKSKSVHAMYCLKDIPSSLFQDKLFHAPVDEHAMRITQAACGDSRTGVAMYPDSFSLYCVGYFVMETGKFIPLDEPRFVSSVRELFDKEQVRLKEVRK